MPTRHRRRSSGCDDDPADDGGAGDDRRRRCPATTAAAAPETTAAPRSTAPPPTLPENVTELDAEATSNINPQPRDALQQGGTLRLAVGSLAENWNRNHPDGNELDFARCVEPMSYFPWLVDAEGIQTLNPDFVTRSHGVRGPPHADVHAQPRGRLAQRRTDHGRRLAGRRGTR